MAATGWMRGSEPVGVGEVEGGVLWCWGWGWGEGVLEMVVADLMDGEMLERRWAAGGFWGGGEDAGGAALEVLEESLEVLERVEEEVDWRTDGILL